MKYSNTVNKYNMFEIELNGPQNGNPFLDYEISASFYSINEMKTVNGFYDGKGTYKIRFMPSFEGAYRFQIKANFQLTDSNGMFYVNESEKHTHGPVRVANKFHFSYDDGEPYYPIGTTCYVWQLQKQDIVEETYQSLKESPFNKLRFCVFPKHYKYNINEPFCYPYEIKEDAPWKTEDFATEKLEKYPRTESGNYIVKIENPEQVWDFTRFNPTYFQYLDKCVENLMNMGIEADLILMHPYDRWGYSRMGMDNENLYLKYIVARLASYRNIWWSLANEFDILKKTIPDWESNAATICKEDVYGHLKSIHNCRYMYDYTYGWITHCSIQKTDPFKTAENTLDWRQRYGKPCVLDEICYEGNISNGWGNISGEEMTKRFWFAYTMGGYAGHGETYMNPEDVIWWSHGGKLRGSSIPRISFLKKIMEESPQIGLDPGPMQRKEAKVSDKYGNYYIYYYGTSQPAELYYHFSQEESFAVEVIDTWNMTIEKKGVFTGTFKIEMPEKMYMAVRLIKK